MKKILNNKKMLILIIIGILTFGFFIFIICIKSIYTFKPSFYTYSSYVDNKTKKLISKNYTYKEYGTVSEFEYAIQNNKAIAGITSDYSIINLIIDGKLAPISQDIKKIIKKESFEWESFFSEVTIDQMNEYNKYLTKEIQTKLEKQFGKIEGREYKFSDFIVPYFINDKVIAFDTKKTLDKPYKPGEKQEEIKFSQTPTLIEAMNEIREKSKKFKVQWSKNERENIVLGSTFNEPETNEKWDTKIEENNYLEWLNNFVKMVQEATGKPINDIKTNLFDTDSDIILNNLINPDSKISVATIYNGDALDAYYGHDNFSSVEDGDRLRIIRTKYTVRILDAFVVSSSINSKEREEILKKFNSSLFGNMFSTKEELEKIPEEEIYETDGIMRIFDNVNYTPAAKGAYEYIKENYFKDENGIDDEIAIDIYEVAKTDPNKGIYVKAIGPIDKEVLSKLTIEFQKRLNGFN